MKKILVSITTTNRSDWRNKIKEARKLSVKELALFPTCLEEKERQELYFLLKKNNFKNVPFVHITNKMSLEELDFLIDEFNVQAFNIHTDREYPFIYDYSKHKKMIFIENVFFPLSEKEVKRFGGVCLDLTHLENDRVLQPEKYQENLKVIEKYSIGCNHLSCFTKKICLGKKGNLRLDRHLLKKIEQMDYLKKYPARYFSKFIAIELENSIKMQLKIKDYLIKKLKII
jgi:hypothetical protein